MKCSNCGTAIDTSASECPGCGAIFESERDGPDVSGAIPSSWLGVGIGAIVAAVTMQFLGPMMGITVGAVLALIGWILGTYLR